MKFNENHPNKKQARWNKEKNARFKAHRKWMRKRHKMPKKWWPWSSKNKKINKAI